MRPLAEQTILITGATDGLGRAVAAELAAAGATLLLHGRAERRGEQTIKEIEDHTGNDRLSFYRADFASLTDVRTMAERVLAEHSELDMLVNNAGSARLNPARASASRATTATSCASRSTTLRASCSRGCSSSC